MRKFRSSRPIASDGYLVITKPKKRGFRWFFAVLVWSVIPSLALVVVASYFGLAINRHVYPPVVLVEGTSMKPLLHFGDLVFLKKFNEGQLRKGDIIAFRTTKDVQQKWNVPGSYVHRIVKVEKGDSGLQFQTKGDNVLGKDPFWTVEQNVIGIYTSRIRGAGYPILFFRSNQGKLLLGGVLLVVLLYWLLGVWERKRSADYINVNNLALIVEQARNLTHRMEETALGPRAPPKSQSSPKSKPSKSGSNTPPDLPSATEENQETIRQLVNAVGEYGKHLQSHTAVMQSLAVTTRELQGATIQMRETLTARPNFQLITTDKMPRLKSSKAGKRGYSRKAVRKLYGKLVAEVNHNRNIVMGLESELAQLRRDRDQLVKDLTATQALQSNLAALLTAAEERATTKKVRRF